MLKYTQSLTTSTTFTVTSLDPDITASPVGYCKGFLTQLLIYTHAPFPPTFNMAASMTVLKHKVDCISPLIRTFPPHLE